MTLRERLLHNLPEWRNHSDQKTWTLHDEETSCSVRLTADLVDVVGVQLLEVMVQHHEEEPIDVRQWAKKVETVTGLLEPLRLIEVDEGRKVALLRSSAPEQQGEEVLYYEAQLQEQGKAVLHRWRASRTAGTKRQQSAFALTHEMVAKLVEDLAHTP